MMIIYYLHQNYIAEYCILIQYVLTISSIHNDLPSFCIKSVPVFLLDLQDLNSFLKNIINPQPQNTLLHFLCICVGKKHIPTLNYT